MKYSVFTVSLLDLSPQDALREMKNAGYDGWISFEDFSTEESTL